VWHLRGGGSELVAEVCGSSRRQHMRVKLVEVFAEWLSCTTDGPSSWSTSNSQRSFRHTLSCVLPPKM
jgi:hypothetical protein